MFKTFPLTQKATDAEYRKAAALLNWNIGYMVINLKFSHQVLLMMNPNPHRGLNTLGVNVQNGKFNLYYDPLVVINLATEELSYVLYHEALHLALHHCTRRPLTTDKKLKHMASVAHDCAVNELIPDDKTSLRRPNDVEGKLCGVFVDELKKQPLFANIKNKQTSEWYFDYFRQKQKDNPEGFNKAFGDGTGRGGGLDDHDGWSEAEVLDSRVANKIKEIEAMGGWGNLSQGSRDIIMAAQVKKINWKNLIRVWAGNHIGRDKTYTRKKPNRRTGYLHPGTRRSYVDKYLLADDTSGSIDLELGSQFFGVMNQMVDEGYPIDYMMFDCTKQVDPRPYDRKQVRLEFVGRGGTNFQPVIDIVNERHYHGVIILTDGQAPAPSRPKNAHVLWVLPKGCTPPVEWGDRVYLERHV